MQLDYNDAANIVTLKVNGAAVVNGMYAPEDLISDLETRFPSVIYNAGGSYQLFGFDPL